MTNPVHRSEKKQKMIVSGWMVHGVNEKKASLERRILIITIMVCIYLG